MWPLGFTRIVTDRIGKDVEESPETHTKLRLRKVTAVLIIGQPHQNDCNLNFILSYD